MSLINVSNLTFSYEGSYDNIFENVSFQIGPMSILWTQKVEHFLSV